MDTDDSETFRLDNLETEVVGGACGAPDRQNQYKNCALKQTVIYCTEWAKSRYTEVAIPYTIYYIPTFGPLCI